MNSLRKINKIKYFFTCCLLLSPIANVYLVPKLGVAMGEVLMMFAIIVVIVVSGLKIRVQIDNGALVAFVLYSLFVTMIVMMSYPTIEISETLKRIIRDGYYFLVIWFFSKHYFDAQKGYRILNCIATLLSLYILIQFLSYLVLKIYIPGFLPGTYIDAGTPELYRVKALKDAAILGYLRPNGFFAEPAQCAHFLSLSILLNLFFKGENKANCTKRIILFTLATVCSTSLNGMVLLVTVYSLYFLHVMRRSNRKSFITALFCGMVFFIVVIFAYLKIPYIRNIVDRLGNISSTTSGSVVMRTMRGIAFFKEMPFFDKLFGIGFGNFIGYRAATGIWTMYEETVEYFNTDAYILISAGLFGSFLLILAIYKYVKKGDAITFAVFFLLFVMGISSSIYSTPLIVVAISFAIFRKRCESKDLENCI